MLIRPFVATDLPAFLPLFHAVVDDGETYAYPEDLGDTEIEALWVEAPPGLTVVAVDEGTGALLGSAKTGPNRPGRGAHVATASFMVAETARGRGVGRALGEWVLAHARAAGHTAMQFNAVVETNTAAVALWRSLGFVVVGTVPEAFESRRHGRVGLHVMHRPL
ncbi:GNAT family N-acetyltransferase [Phycicoccus sp. HDW14]|uniref:GNAT family N-acetyltransferase n=1 Tax=Phycicoccus sp. HDW14 TaxID=2714941 RepID=UPI00140D3719|nr:GNAT family N-acetyltransferase [Phycicoccus sp. HDW14]QIM22595.1 GNAT family N-acetyltransferase [Phycicoccus sp. HDW14]